ncbi:uncharacterized protein M6B38_320880 [Iris pallida]|uniref:Uncharacterized protein n=1 Tax=Iris pallida TaxID=29817 RepID=A0AAX6HCW8_IRIPA|nr:uncharacterized protein M6B38_320880 [Iris pallida]
MGARAWVRRSVAGRGRELGHAAESTGAAMGLPQRRTAGVTLERCPLCAEMRRSGTASCDLKRGCSSCGLGRRLDETIAEEVTGSGSIRVAVDCGKGSNHGCSGVASNDGLPWGCSACTCDTTILPSEDDGTGVALDGPWRGMGQGLPFLLVFWCGGARGGWLCYLWVMVTGVVLEM